MISKANHNALKEDFRQELQTKVEKRKQEQESKVQEHVNVNSLRNLTSEPEPSQEEQEQEQEQEQGQEQGQGQEQRQEQENIIATDKTPNTKLTQKFSDFFKKRFTRKNKPIDSTTELKTVKNTTQLTKNENKSPKKTKKIKVSESILKMQSDIESLNDKMYDPDILVVMDERIKGVENLVTVALREINRIATLIYKYHPEARTRPKPIPMPKPKPKTKTTKIQQLTKKQKQQQIARKMGKSTKQEYSLNHSLA